MTRCPYCNNKKFTARATVARTDVNNQPNAWKNQCIKCKKESIFDNQTGRQEKIQKWLSYQ